MVLRALDELVRAARQWSLYGSEHRLTREACDAAAEALVAMMSERKQFTLAVAESGLVAEGEELPDHAPLQQLHEAISRRQIAAVTVRPGLTRGEVAAVISVLATDPDELLERGGAGRVLSEAQCPHVDLTDVDYGRLVPESQAEWMSTFAGSEIGIQASVQNLASICLDALGDRVTTTQGGPASDRGVPMPFPIPVIEPKDGDAESEESSLEEQVGALPDVSPEDYVAVGLAWLIQASGEAVLESPSKVRRAWRETVAQRVASIDLPLQARIFRAPRQAGSTAPDMLAALAADRSPEQIADLILARPAAVVGEPSGSLERILRRTLTDERKLLALEPLLRERLMARGMSQDSFRNVVGLLLDQIATDMAMRVGGAVEWIGDFEDLPPSEGGTVEQWPELLKTISREAVAKSRASILLSMLKHDLDAAHYLDLVGHIEACAAERAAANDPGVLDIVCSLAAEVDAGDPTRSPIAKAGLERLATREIAHAMRAALEKASAEQRLELIAVIGKMGNECAAILLEQIETAEDHQVRAVAARCLAEAGERGASEVRHLLAQGPFDVAMFTAAALVEGGDERFLSLLAAGFDHRQPAVRMRLAEWLGRIPGLASEQLLIRALYDEDPDVQARAAESLGALGATGAVHALSLAAKKGPLHGRALEVRKAAIEALGKLGSPEGVPVLEEIARKRSLLFRDRTHELAALAAAALACIAGPEAERALAECGLRQRDIARPQDGDAPTISAPGLEGRRGHG